MSTIAGSRVRLYGDGGYETGGWGYGNRFSFGDLDSGGVVMAGMHVRASSHQMANAIQYLLPNGLTDLRRAVFSTNYSVLPCHL